eukprot:2588414-Rhodomonas_salina.4
MDFVFNFGEQWYWTRDLVLDFNSFAGFDITVRALPVRLWTRSKNISEFPGTANPLYQYRAVCTVRIGRYRKPP